MTAMSSTSLVVKGSAAEALMDPATLDLLRPFMREALSVKEASARLGLPFAKAYYRVRRMRALGLLAVAGQEPRKGRPVTRYRAAAPRFFVPFQATSADDLKGFLRDFEAQWAEPMLDARVHSLLESGIDLAEFGFGFELNEAGYFMFVLASGPDEADLELGHGPAFSSTWDTSLYLSREDAATLSEEVEAVLARYREKRSGPRHAVHFACAPWRPR
jgi:hypothetical protein